MKLKKISSEKLERIDLNCDDCGATITVFLRDGDIVTAQTGFKLGMNKAQCSQCHAIYEVVKE